MKKSYTQASKVINSTNIEDVIQVKKAFPALSADEVGKMLKAKNSNGGMKKPKINMTIRGQSRREVIISMTRANAELIVNSAHIHTTNINKCLKNSNSNIVADFIHFNVVIYKSTCPENYIPAVMPPLNPTSPPSTAATFLATRLMVVLQPSGYSVFYDGDTPIQLSLP